MRRETLDAQEIGVRHETIDAPKVRRETRDVRRVSSLTSNVSRPRPMAEGHRKRKVPQKAELFKGQSFLFFNRRIVSKKVCN